MRPGLNLARVRSRHDTRTSALLKLPFCGHLHTKQVSIVSTPTRSKLPFDHSSSPHILHAHPPVAPPSLAVPPHVHSVRTTAPSRTSGHRLRERGRDARSDTSVEWADDAGEPCLLNSNRHGGKSSLKYPQGRPDSKDYNSITPPCQHAIPVTSPTPSRSPSIDCDHSAIMPIHRHLFPFSFSRPYSATAVSKCRSHDSPPPLSVHTAALPCHPT